MYCCWASVGSMFDIDYRKLFFNAYAFWHASIMHLSTLWSNACEVRLEHFTLSTARRAAKLISHTYNL